MLGTTQAPPVSHVRPSATILYRSVAQIYGAEAIALLTGMGDDGAAGLRAILGRGGLTMAQDEASSVVYGMPKVELGAVNYVLPLHRIAPTLLELLRETR